MKAGGGKTVRRNNNNLQPKPMAVWLVCLPYGCTEPLAAALLCLCGEMVERRRRTKTRQQNQMKKKKEKSKAFDMIGQLASPRLRNRMQMFSDAASEGRDSIIVSTSACFCRVQSDAFVAPRLFAFQIVVARSN